MDCECINPIGGKPNSTPRIIHVFGNVLRVAIPLTLRNVVKDGDEIVVTDTDFIPSSDYPVNVIFLKGKKAYQLTATMDGNVATVEDDGNIAIGTYDIIVECRDDIGRHYRFKQNAVLRVVDATAEAGIEEEIEYEVKTWYLNAAVYLATTEIGSMSEEIDRKLEDVFGDAEYDESEQLIKFYNKDKTRVLASIDSRPFVVDGTVDNVYIDVSRQVLVVVLNADAGGRIFTVPLYLIFSNYYNKTQVDALLANVQVDTSALLDKENYTNPSGQTDPLGGVIKYSRSARTVLDFIDGIGGMHEVGYNVLYGGSNGHIYAGNGDGGVTDLGLANGQAFLNADDNLWYRFDDGEWLQVGGSGESGYNVTYSNGNLIFGSGSSEPTYSNGNLIL